MSLKRKICFACAVVYFMLCGGRVRFGGGWHGVHGSVETAGMMWSSVDQCGPVHCSVVVCRYDVDRPIRDVFILARHFQPSAH